MILELVVLLVFISIVTIYIIVNNRKYKKWANIENEVILEDKYAEYKLDAEDIDDPKIYVKVVYTNSGKILSTKPYSSTERFELDKKQNYKDLLRFADICNINIYGGMDDFKKYTAYKD